MGGTVAGLAPGSSIALQNNGVDSVTVNSNSSFTFPTSITAGGAYAVTLVSQPSGHQCTVASASGTVQATVSSVRVDCVVSSYSIGGTVAGLLPSTAVTLRNNAANDLVVNADGAFLFTAAVPFGSAYDVRVHSEPQDRACTVNGGSGTVAAANVTNVQVTCVEKTYGVGGTVTGLEPGSSVALRNNGGDLLTVSANGSFTFAGRLTGGSNYSVSAAPTWQPGQSLSPQPGRNCIVSAGSGVVAGSDVTNIAVQCVNVHLLYSFGTTQLDGASPSALVFGSDGNLYGTTGTGGNHTANTPSNQGGGTFFKLTAAGAHTVLWHFGAGQDGQAPHGRLIVGADGNFYGTTSAGGSNGAGTLYKMTPDGQETVLWNFGAVNDGTNPYGGVLIGQDGNLYGTTLAGGTLGHGIVFQLTPAGVYTVLWNFGAGADGRGPGRLVQANDGNFYGTTHGGGTLGYGTVFRITPAGVEQVLYSFGQGIGVAYIGPNGIFPTGLTLGPDGALYGTAYGGGIYGAGTAFKVTTSGVATMLWHFGAGDGVTPLNGLTLGADGNFYGTTFGGGGLINRSTLFSVTPAGGSKVLWRFNDNGNGEIPSSVLVRGTDGAIYGTTAGGGQGTYGARGTVYKLTM